MNKIVAKELLLKNTLQFSV